MSVPSKIFFHPRGQHGRVIPQVARRIQLVVTVQRRSRRRSVAKLWCSMCSRFGTSVSLFEVGNRKLGYLHQADSLRGFHRTGNSVREKDDCHHWQGETYETNVSVWDAKLFSLFGPFQLLDAFSPPHHIIISTTWSRLPYRIVLYDPPKEQEQRQQQLRR
jgi:hypothetical protein